MNGGSDSLRHLGQFCTASDIFSQCVFGRAYKHSAIMSEIIAVAKSKRLWQLFGLG